jgi:hypothetical protein
MVTLQLKPFDRSQINLYLDAAKATSLRDAVESDPELYELAQTPLTLSIMTLAYDGRAPVSLPPNLPLTERRLHLFDDYVKRMLEWLTERKANKPLAPGPREDKPPRYSPEEVNRFLGWLAVRLSERAQTSFAPRDLASLLEKKIAPTARYSWTELRLACLIYVLLLSAVLSVSYFVAAHPVRLPWPLILVGPTLYGVNQGFEWWIKKQAPDSFSFRKCMRDHFIILAVFVVVAVVQMSPWIAPRALLGAIVLSSFGVGTLLFLPGYMIDAGRPGIVASRFPAAGCLLGGGLVLIADRPDWLVSVSLLGSFLGVCCTHFWLAKLPPTLLVSYYGSSSSGSFRKRARVSYIVQHCLAILVMTGGIHWLRDRFNLSFGA